MCICSVGFKQADYVITSSAVQELNLSQEIDLSPLIGQHFESDVEFKKALSDQLGRSAAKQHEATLLQAAANINAVVILVGILAFVASFAVSLGPVMWVLLAEIFPNHLRGVAISIVGLINSGVSFCVQVVFPWELSTLGASTTFFLFGIMALVSLVFIVKLLPETKGKSLEVLQEELTLSSPNNSTTKKTNKVLGDIA
nr:MFS transporter [Marinibactrum halimedae]